MTHDDIRAVLEACADSRQAGRRMARQISDSLAVLATDGEISADDITGVLVGLLDRASWGAPLPAHPESQGWSGSRVSLARCPSTRRASRWTHHRTGKEGAPCDTR